ncbi:unnamed protein product [Sphagnum balticum]
MSSSSSDEIPVEELTHDMREQRIIANFDYHTTQGDPPRGSAILRVVGFGVITIVGIDPKQARIGDIAVEIAHNGFHTRAEVWVKVDRLLQRTISPTFTSRELKTYSGLETALSKWSMVERGCV